MTITQIVNETVKYYTTHQRAFSSEGRCVYINNKGDRWAVGRCVYKDKAKEWENKGGGQITFLKRGALNKALFPKYKGHPITFWGDLQSLHDNVNYWKGNTLTPEGEKWVEYIIDTYEKHKRAS